MVTVTSTEMKLCDKVTKVTATMAEDGMTINIAMDSNCSKVKAYAEKIKSLNMMEIMEYSNEIPVFRNENRAGVCVPCLTPNAVLYAAWLEAGLISKNLAKKSERNAVRFDIE